MEASLNDILNNAADEVAAPAAAAPVAGRQRAAVGGGGSSIAMQVGDTIEAVFNGTSDVAGKFGTSKLYKFTLIAPATLTVVTKDKESGKKSEERKTLEAGSVVTMFLKGNGPHMMSAIADGMDIELKRIEDGVLPKGHKFEGTAVQTFEVYA